jgi:hypothetical protein
MHPSFEYYAPRVLPNKRLLQSGVCVLFTPIEIVKPTNYIDSVVNVNVNVISPPTQHPDDVEQVLYKPRVFNIVKPPPRTLSLVFLNR